VFRAVLKSEWWRSGKRNKSLRCPQSFSAGCYPERDELPDQNEEEWQLGRNGKVEDPWKDTRYVLMVDPVMAAEFTFITDTWGGRKAVSDLKSQIVNAPGASGRDPDCEADQWEHVDQIWHQAQA